MFKLVDTILPETKEMRKVLCETMMEMAKEDPSVVYFDCDVMNSIGMVPFAKEYPDRAVNCGIQEAKAIPHRKKCSECITVVKWDHE